MTTDTRTPDNKTDGRSLAELLPDVLAHATVTDGCWPWTGPTDASGYSILYRQRRTVLAHRAAYAATHGPIPPGHIVVRLCHDPETCEGGPTCPHRRCVNPDHLAATPRAAPPRSLLPDVLARTLITPDGCWLWTGRLTRGGYGRIDRHGRSLLVHRVTYESTHGPIPEGLVIDHTCHRPGSCPGGPTCPHRRCVNPSHMAAVTVAENTARRSRALPRTRCGRGHPLTGQNLTPNARGSLVCRLCRRIDNRAAYAAGMPVPPSEVRTWARRRGIPVPARGKLSAAVLAAWDAAHPARPYVPRRLALDSTTGAGGAEA